MIAIISDIHSNLAALQAVLDDFGEVEQIWSLGDLVGYGPNPNEVLDILKGKLSFSLTGNHDLGSIGQMDLNAFTPDAKEACLFTDKKITLENRRYLEGTKLVEGLSNFSLVHASPREPVWEYILNVEAAFENFDYFETPFCFVGHTHMPVIFKRNKPNAVAPREDAVIELDLDDKVIINPGSVGQPRDGDPRSSYLLLDDKNLTIAYKRVEYDVKAIQEAMEEAGLPRNLIDRLEHGL